MCSSVSRSSRKQQTRITKQVRIPIVLCKTCNNVLLNDTVSNKLTHRGSSLLYGIHKANCVMAEADAMVGDASRAPLSISAKVGLEDGFVLSGMRLGNGTQVSQSVIPQV